MNLLIPPSLPPSLPFLLFSFLTSWWNWLKKDKFPILSEINGWLQYSRHIISPGGRIFLSIITMETARTTTTAAPCQNRTSLESGLKTLCWRSFVGRCRWWLMCLYTLTYCPPHPSLPFPPALLLRTDINCLGQCASDCLADAAGDSLFNKFVIFYVYVFSFNAMKSRRSSKEGEEGERWVMWLLHTRSCYKGRCFTPVMLVVRGWPGWWRVHGTCVYLCVPLFFI